MLFRNSSLIINLGISSIGLIVVSFLVFFPSNYVEITWQKQIISIVFAALCFFGMIAVFFPNICSKIAFGNKQNNTINLSSDRFSSFFGITLIHGHHSTLKQFSNHEFRLRNKSICAGCFGLFIGGFISFIGIIMYNFLDIVFFGVPQQLVGLGVVAVTLAIFSPIFYNASSFVRIFLNIFLILGMLFILIGIDILFSSFGINIFLIGLFIFFIISRISVSKYNHDKIYSKK